MAVAVLYERVFCEIREATNSRSFTRIAGAAHGAKVQWGKQFDAKPFSEGRASLADGNVDSIGTEVGKVLASDRSHVDGGMSSCKAGQARHKPLRGEGWRHADSYPCAFGPEFSGRAVDDREGPADGPVVAAADMSERQSACFAAKQLKPQVGFKPPYLLRYGPLSYVQFF